MALTKPAPTEPPESPARDTAPVQKVQSPLPRAVSGDAAQQAGLLALLEIEALVRSCSREEQLHLVMTHETQKIVRCGQCFLLIEAMQGDLQVASISGLSAVDRTVPLVRAIERATNAQVTREARAQPHAIDLTVGGEDDNLRSYPFAHTLWVPLQRRDGSRLGGLLLAREAVWSDADSHICARLADPYAYALEALRRQPTIDRAKLLSWRTSAAVLLAAALVLAIPVPMTTLAPVEIVPLAPAIVTAGADGVIEHLDVEPNGKVQSGQLLARLVDVNARNRLELADREVVVAEAKIKKWQQMSFGDPRANHELAIASAELRLRGAERDWAREQLGLLQIRAGKAGIAVFADKKELIGKPVAVGEKIMEIADPDRIEARIDVSISDSLFLNSGARTKLFLDSDPLDAREGKIVEADYQARVRPNGTLALRAVAHLTAAGSPLPRLGARGTAQIYGDTVPLAYYLFRRPVSALRQWTGL